MKMIDESGNEVKRRMKGAQAQANAMKEEAN
jgi:hypothetical protein